MKEWQRHANTTQYPVQLGSGGPIKPYPLGVVIGLQSPISIAPGAEVVKSIRGIVAGPCFDSCEGEIVLTNLYPFLPTVHADLTIQGHQLENLRIRELMDGVAMAIWTESPPDGTHVLLGATLTGVIAETALTRGHLVPHERGACPEGRLSPLSGSIGNRVTRWLDRERKLELCSVFRLAEGAIEDVRLTTKDGLVTVKWVKNGIPEVRDFLFVPD